MYLNGNGLTKGAYVAHRHLLCFQPTVKDKVDIFPVTLWINAGILDCDMLLNEWNPLEFKNISENNIAEYVILLFRGLSLVEPFIVEFLSVISLTGSSPFWKFFGRLAIALCCASVLRTN